jgi:argininosuccinate synthase
MNLNEVIVPEKCIFFHLQVHKQGCIFISSIRNTLPSEILTVFHINKSYIRTEVHLMADIKEKVVLAYSGGLDTTAIIPWLKETYGYDVIACCVNVGQESELTNLDERAAASGASKLYELDCVDEFADEYIAPCIQAHAVYEDKYLLGTSMARPLIAKKLVEVARKENAVAICHGATGKGNDQLRFELGIKALAPDIKIIAPWRDPKWTMQSREDEINYIRQHGISLPFSSEDNAYSRDRNLWHISHEGLELENPANEPDYDHLLVLTTPPQKAPDKETKISIDFEHGVPVALNGEKMKLSDIIRALNKLGGENGIGIIDIVENRVVGMKSRGVYETPGGTILYEAHQQLEELILDRKTYEEKKRLSSDFAGLVYEGKWFSPLREADQAFFEKVNEYETGTVNLILYKGNIIKAGTTAVYSMYNESLASFTTGDLYDHKDASGFITLFGLPEKVRAMKMMEVKAKEKCSPAKEK